MLTPPCLIDIGSMPLQASQFLQMNRGFIRQMAPNPQGCGKLRGYKCRDRRNGLVRSRGAME
jgi:hypothetical protein